MNNFNIDVILLNLIKMLTKRNILLDKNLNKNYKNLLGQKNEENIYNIKYDTSDNICYIMIINGKITSIKKIDGIDNFNSLSKNKHKIFIANIMSSKPYKQLIDTNTEIFFLNDLLIDVTEHELQPKFELLNEEQKKDLLENYDISIKNISKILLLDQISRYYNAKVGDIFRITRPSITAGNSITYRVVIDCSINYLFD